MVRLEFSLALADTSGQAVGGYLDSITFVAEAPAPIEVLPIV